MEEERNYLRRSYFDQDEGAEVQRRLELQGGFGEGEGVEDELAIGDKLKEENYYKYHENVAQFDPRGQPFSYFYITVMGQVEFGEFLEDHLDGLQLHYSFVSGEDWGVADG